MKVALVGATGVVGETILRVLEERGMAIACLDAFASRARPESIVFCGRDIAVHEASPEALAAGGYGAVFFASSDDASARLAPAALASGAVVIDNSATYRLSESVPLVVPEVNAAAIGPRDMLFPVANCTAILLVVGLAPLQRAAGLHAVRVATYQAVSGAGRAGLDALRGEERSALADGVGERDPASPFRAPIFRNVVPQVGSLDELGDSGEEKKVVAETRKILGLPGLHVAATTVRVPVRRAHAEAVFFTTARDTNVGELSAALMNAPGVVFHPHGIVTPLDVEDKDLVHVARLRSENGSNRHFQMWVVGDQLRKGAATNAVQILEELFARGRFAARESTEARI
jgi:aspartate-semialdehyde dehydrogenase